jgi:lipopolysaccharide transport system ATP-binding protein
VNGDESAIKVTHLSKCYLIYDKPQDRLKQSIYPRLQRLVGRQPVHYYREFWALKDVSFEIKKGETVGIIGRNGSGKSTLLQMICGTLAPTSGHVQTHGRIAALLELGSGFNPEFTGRENVYMNGAIMGLSHDEINARFEDVEAFAEIGQFIEQPVKTYSSGMFVRLAFASNIMSNPDIMIVDEALAVGDMKFQAKCMTALTRMQERGTTVLFVSHDIGALKSLCSKGIYLERGSVKAIGKASEVAEGYIKVMREEMNAEHRQCARMASGVTLEKRDADQSKEDAASTCDVIVTRSDEFTKRVAAYRYGAGGTRITFAELLNMGDDPIAIAEFNQEVKLRIYVEASASQRISVNFYILDDKKINVTGSGFIQAGHELLPVHYGGHYQVEYIIKLPFQEGSYSVCLEVTSPVIVGETAEFLDVIEDALTFQVMKMHSGRVWAKTYLFPKLHVKTLSETATKFETML